jgi:hypothetical protein
MGSESAFLKRKTSRFVGGITADVWGPFALLVGFQMYEKTFGGTTGHWDTVYVDDLTLLTWVTATTPGYDVGNGICVTEASEMLVMGGLRVKLAPLSYLSLQGGMLKNELEYTIPGLPTNKISISKLVLLADVTVNF